MTQTTGSRIDQILHDIFFIGLSAASIFVKNPNSQAHAASIADLLQRVVLPVADSLLAPPAPPPPVFVQPQQSVPVVPAQTIVKTA